MDFRCIIVIAFLRASPADGAIANAHAEATAHKAFPGGWVGLPGSHDPAAWKRNDPDKSAYEPMGGSFRAQDPTPDTPNSDEDPDDIEDKPEQPGGYYLKEIAIEKGKAARHESLLGPSDAWANTPYMKRHHKFDNPLDETFLECDAHPERCKNEDLEEEAKNKEEMETTVVDTVILDNDSDDDYDDEGTSKAKLGEFPWKKAHADMLKNHPVLVAKKLAAENKKHRIEIDKKLQAAGSPDVKIPVAIDYDKLKMEKAKNYDIDCDGPHGDPKNCQKYDGDDIDIESAEQAEFHHHAMAWRLSTLANRNPYNDDEVAPGAKPTLGRFAHYRNFDADNPGRYDDIDSLHKDQALERAEEIREADSVGDGGSVDTEEEKTLRRNNAQKLAKAHRKKLPEPTQAEKFAIAEKIKLAEANDALDVSQKDIQRKNTKAQESMHAKKFKQKTRTKHGEQGEAWTDKLSRAYSPWSQSTTDHVAKKAKERKTNSEHLRR